MDSEDSSLENECENLMNVVVESRKRFGKMCVDYDNKISLMENKILHLQTDSLTNYKFKPKNSIPAPEDSKEIEEVALKVAEMAKRFENIRKRVKDTQEVVSQLKRDDIGKRLRESTSADAVLARVKENEDS